MDNCRFKLILLEEAKKFLDGLEDKARKKIEYNIRRVQCGEINNELFKKLENTDIWEFRTHYNKTAYRMFAFWDTDEETLVIATHGIIKKTQKTTPAEIGKAQAIKNHYFEIKNNPQQ